MGNLGFFGSDVFGRGFWGWASVGLRLSGTVVSPRLIADLTQETPNGQIIAGTVEIGGIDVTEYVESIAISLSDSNATGTAEIVFISDVSATVAQGASATISFQFTLEDGTVFTNRAMRGVVRTVVPVEGSQSISTQVALWDKNESLLSSRPKNTTWTGTAKNLVRSELSELGIDDYSLVFYDYTMTSAALSFTTVRDLILAVANGADECGLFTTQTGRLCVWSYVTARTVSRNAWSAGSSPIADLINSPLINASWDGSATALIYDELGLPDDSLGVWVFFTDFTFTSDLSGFATKKDLLIHLLDASDDDYFQLYVTVPVEYAEYWEYSSGEEVYYNSDSGGWTAVVGSAFTFPRTSYTYLQEINVARERYKTYTVTGTTGTDGSATGTGTSDGGESSPFISFFPHLNLRAAAVVAKRERKRLSFQVSLNPLVRVGDQISVERSAGTYSTCRVTSVTHSIEWSGENSPGAWSNIVAEVIPA